MAVPRARCFGVVEGFYGRPWSQEQRRELADMMQTIPGGSAAPLAGLDTYMYSVV